MGGPWQAYVYIGLITIGPFIIMLIHEYHERKRFAEFKRHNNIK